MSPDKYYLFNGRKDDLPAVIVIDREALAPNLRKSHQWHLSVIMDCVELALQGMPTSAEYLVLDREGDRIEEIVLATGCGAFMARITWNGTRQFLFRVSDPEPVAQALDNDIASGQSKRAWDFRLWQDPDWKEAEWYANALQAG